MAAAGVLVLEDLRSMTGYERACDIKRKLKSQGIRVFEGRPGHIWTTQDLINAAGGLATPPAEQETYSPEII